VQDLPFANGYSATVETQSTRHISYTSEIPRKKSAIYASATFLVCAILYWFSIEPGVGSWDVGEMQTVLYILGIAHTTGYPALTLIGWLFSHLFAVGSIAWRINILGALFLASASSAVCLIQIRNRVRPAIAALSSIIFATGPIVWAHAIRIDVLSMTVLLVALVLLLLVRWSQERDATSFYAACICIGIGLGGHLIILWILPAVVIYVIRNRAAIAVRMSLTGPLLAATSAICIYAYLPIRSAIVTANRYDKTLDLGLPPGHPYWDYAHPATIRGFDWLVTGGQVHASSSIGSMLSLRTCFFGIVHFVSMTAAEFSIIGAAVLVVGFLVGFRKCPEVTVFIAVSCFLIADFTAAFQAESDPDRYFMVSFVLLSIPLGVGLEAIATALARKWERFGYKTLVVAVIALIVTGVYRERAIFGWHYDRWGSDYVNRIRSLTADNAIIVAPWVVATPLAYAEYVEKSYGDRIVETGDLKDDSPYIQAWTSARPVYVVLDRYAPAGRCLVRMDGGDPPIFRVTSRCAASRNKRS
jgi:Protein of unknown function (DUF2723)